jgi:hypothetical protein
MLFLLVIGLWELKLQSLRHSGICAPVVLVVVLYRCILLALWLGRDSCSVRWPNTGPLQQHLMAEQYEEFMEEHVTRKPGWLGKNLTLCHHRCHSDNAGRRDTEPAMNCLSGGPTCATVSLANTLKSTHAGCLRKKIHDFQALSKSLHLIFHRLYFNKPNSHSCLGISIQTELTKSASINYMQFLPGNLCTEGCLPVNWIAGHIRPQCNGTACFHHDLEHVSPTTNGNTTCERTPCSPPTGTRNSHRTPVGSRALPATCGHQFDVHGTVHR